MKPRNDSPAPLTLKVTWARENVSSHVFAAIDVNGNNFHLVLSAALLLFSVPDLVRGLGCLRASPVAWDGGAAVGGAAAVGGDGGGETGGQK